MTKYALLGCMMSVILSGCSLLPRSGMVLNTDAQSVARYNLTMLSVCNLNTPNYLYVDKNFDTTLRNLFIYINDLNEDLMKAQLCCNALIDYNKSVINKLS